MTFFDDAAHAGALFSACGSYRYRLWRVWDRKLPVLFVCMLNPSTAHATKLDPTTTRLVGFARDHGFGGWVVTNLFAVKSTDPKGMLTHTAPIGPENDVHLAELADAHDYVLCAWGAHGSHLGRHRHVLELFRARGCQPLCLRVTKGGAPEHPLYLPASLRMQPYEVSRVA